MKLLLPFFILFCCFSCGQDGATVASITEIPKLLERSEKLVQGNEWDDIQNRYANALKRLRKDETDHNARLSLVEVFIHEARVTGEHGHYYPGALAVIDQIFAAEPADRGLLFRANSWKASVLLSQHEFHQALAYGLKANEYNNRNASNYGALVDAYVELGDYDQALKMADIMGSIRPDLRCYARISYLREIHGDYKGAIKAMQMAVQAGVPGTEDRAWAMLTLGDLLLNYGKINEAQAIYQAILKERENYPFAVGALANIAAIKKDYSKTKELLKRACSIIPEFSFYEQEAALCQELGQEQRTKELLEELFAMLQDDLDSGHIMNLEFANIHLNITKDYDKAFDYTYKEYQARPKNIDVNKMMAFIQYKKGAIDEAQMHLEKAMLTNSSSPDLLCLSGLIKVKDGESAVGRKEIKSAFELNPYQQHSLVDEAKKHLDLTLTENI